MSADTAVRSRRFPSGHSLGSIVCYGAILLVFLPAARGRWRPALITVITALVVLIGISRILLGVHFLSDVIGAWAPGNIKGPGSSSGRPATLLSARPSASSAGSEGGRRASMSAMPAPEAVRRRRRRARTAGRS